MATRRVNRILLANILKKEDTIPEDFDIINVKIYGNGRIVLSGFEYDSSGAKLKDYTINKLTSLHTLE